MENNNHSRPWSIGQCKIVSRLNLDEGAVMCFEQVYSRPELVRSYAMGLNNWSQGRGQYPGHFLFTPIPTQFYCSLLSELIGKSVVPHDEYKFAPFAKIRDDKGDFQQKETMPHVDSFCDYIAIISLSNKDDIAPGTVSGTSFWKHIPTGFSNMPYHKRKEQHEHFFTKNDESLWEKIGFIQHRFNNMLVFPSNAFHRIEFLNADKNAIRLTQNLYVVANK